MQSELNECREIDIPQEVLTIWEKYQLKESLRRHCMKVMEVALNIAKGIKGIDIHAVKIGGLLHDIGWAVTHDPFKHFIEGAKILRKEGFPENIVLIVERHFGAGLTKHEAKRLGLPEKDYLPISLEEKVICHSDNLVHMDKERTFEEYLNRLDRMKRERPELRWLVEKSRERAKKLRDELDWHAG
jgi:uncharacterized protein